MSKTLAFKGILLVAGREKFRKSGVSRMLKKTVQ